MWHLPGSVDFAHSLLPQDVAPTCLISCHQSYRGKPISQINGYERIENLFCKCFKLGKKGGGQLINLLHWDLRSVCCCSVTKSCLTPCNSWAAAHQASRSFTISQRLLKLLCIELVMPSNHLILCCPLILLPSIFPSIRVFSSGSALRIRWPKYWSFSISPSNEYTRLVSIKIDWFDLLAFQGTLKSSPAPHVESINTLALSLFYGTALTSMHDSWKNHSFDSTGLCWQSDLCFLIHCLGLLLHFFHGANVLISWLRSPSEVILEPKKIKSVTFPLFPIYMAWSDGTRCRDLSFLNVEF